MISDSTREKWDEKIETVIEAYKRKLIKLDDYEKKFIFNMLKKRRAELDLNRNQSSFLSGLHQRVY